MPPSPITSAHSIRANHRLRPSPPPSTSSPPIASDPPVACPPKIISTQCLQSAHCPSPLLIASVPTISSTCCLRFFYRLSPSPPLIASASTIISIHRLHDPRTLARELHPPPPVVALGMQMHIRRDSKLPDAGPMNGVGREDQFPFL